MKEILDRIIEFNAVRGWKKHHDPRSVILALMGEVGELAQIFRWKKRTSRRLSAEELTSIQEEIADILIFTFTLCFEFDIDPGEAIASKLDENEVRFPISSPENSHSNEADKPLSTYEG